MNDQRTLRALLRQNLSAFVERSFYEVDNSQTFIPSPHIDLITDKLTQVYEGNIKRLIINLPPRSLKSLITSIAFPAWVLGKDPTKRIITISYSEELSSKLSRDSRSLMESQWYQELFPKTRIRKKHRNRIRNHPKRL